MGPTSSDSVSNKSAVISYIYEYLVAVICRSPWPILYHAKREGRLSVREQWLEFYNMIFTLIAAEMREAAYIHVAAKITFWIISQVVCKQHTVSALSRASCVLLRELGSLRAYLEC